MDLDVLKELKVWILRLVSYVITVIAIIIGIPSLRGFYSMLLSHYVNDNYYINFGNYRQFLMFSMILVMLFLFQTQSYNFKHIIIISCVLPMCFIGGINYLSISVVARIAMCVIMAIYIGSLLYHHREKLPLMRKYPLDYLYKGIKLASKMTFIVFIVFTVLLLFHSYESLAYHVRDKAEYVRPITTEELKALDEFNDKEFFALPEEEQMAILKKFLGIEVERLGIHNLNLRFSELKESTYGQYAPGFQTIEIDLEKHRKMNDVGILLNTLCHECYHAYQKEVDEYLTGVNLDTNLYLLRDVKDWRSESLNGQMQEVDEDGKASMYYFGSSKERTARLYAKERVAYYAQYIAGIVIEETDK